MNPFHLVFDVLAQLNEDLGLLTKREVDLGEVARRGKLIRTMHPLLNLLDERRPQGVHFIKQIGTLHHMPDLSKNVEKNNY